VLRFVKIGLRQFSLYTSNCPFDRVFRVSQFCIPLKQLKFSPLSSSAHIIGQICVTSSSSSPSTTTMTFRCLIIGQSLLLIHHYHFWSQISMIRPYHCFRNDQISWKQVWNHSNRISDDYDLIKTILAWWMAQIQSDIRLHVDSAVQNLIPRLEARLGSNIARLNSAQLSSWMMTWQVGPTMLTCQMTGHWLVMPTGMMTSRLRHNDVMLIRVWTRVGSTGIRVGSVQPGEEDVCDACRASVCRGNLLAVPWRRVRLFPTSNFDAVFNSGFVSSSSAHWYGQNTILTTFIFEQKSNTTLNQMLWYQLLGIPGLWCSDICSEKGKHTDTIFNVVRQNCLHPRESPYYLEIRERIQ